MRCHFSWSPASRPDETQDPSIRITPEELITRTKQHLRCSSRTFVRFTGGEPTLQWHGVSAVLRKMREDEKLVNLPILIQTNGIEIGKGKVPLDVFCEDIPQRCLFELSFKGTNPNEFALLTGKSADLYHYQIRGFKILANLAKIQKNIAVVAVLGVYHSSTRGRSKYAFVSPQNGALLFDNYDAWDDDFKTLWERTSLKWVEPLRMSPLGVWKSIVKRCGPEGAGVIQHYPDRIPTNVSGAFPVKPKSFEYARKIVNRMFWL